MRLLRLLLRRMITVQSLPLVLVETLTVFVALSAHGAANSSWDQPAGVLADQVAAILGPCQVHLTLRNLSTISNDEVPVIRGLLEQHLRAHGITSSSDEAANLLRITFSENARERLWVAEIVEGNETRVVMIHVDPAHELAPQLASGVTIHKQLILTSHDPILAALVAPTSLVALETERIVVYAQSSAGWTQVTSFPIAQKHSLVRDPRGIIIASADGQGFEADIPGIHCTGAYAGVIPGPVWTIRCHESDDPWSIGAPSINTPPLDAFYNVTRDYFTGIVAPSRGVDLPPFYDAAWFPHTAVTALLINGVDGRLQLVEGATIKQIAGARDWGSDFAAIQSGCGSGTQIIASGSGPAAQDSLRAYEIPALEATPASAPLAVNGSVSALWTAPGAKSIIAVVRTSPQTGQSNQYEVDRVTATCN